MGNKSFRKCDCKCNIFWWKGANIFTFVKLNCNKYNLEKKRSIQVHEFLENFLPLISEFFLEILIVINIIH